ncbi:MAG: GMC family oxidoreductase [Bdellovibrionales bacterium]|nr:GMC family oxidoreductase [Bdellovibrionales bacterium]
MKRRDFIHKVTRSAIAATLSTPVLSFAGESISVGENEFEFIIIGSGAGGGPLAVNLVKAGFSVLLIEAGGDQLPLSSQIPAYHALSSEDSEISWDYFVQHYRDPNRHAKWNANTKTPGVLYPRSSVIGGCTAHNAMICLYPDHDDWNRIFNLSGQKDQHWQSSYMRNLFLNRIEKAHYFSDPNQNQAWHHLEMTPFSLAFQDPQLLKIVLGAAKADDGYSAERKSFILDVFDKIRTGQLKDFTDLDTYLDANRKHNIGREGLFRIPKSTYKGKRFGVYEHVMQAKKSHPQKLTIIPHTLVKRIVFEKTASGEVRAIGVEALKGKHLYHAHKQSDQANVHEEVFYKAKREVILSAGAFNSPQLLMLSGIGPEDQINSSYSEVEPLLRLDGVGKNLQDRYEVTVVSELNHDLELLKGSEFSVDTENSKDQSLIQWLNKKTREKSIYSTNGVVVSLKMKSSVCQEGKTDLVLFGAPGDFRGYKPGYAREALAHKNRFTWAILKGHSRNRSGEVTLRPPKNSRFYDPRETPHINFKYFKDGHDQDLQAVIEGVEKVRAINNESFSRATRYRNQIDRPADKRELYPGRQIQAQSDMQSWIKKEAWGHHASCTNKMGLHPSDGSVVNTDFKVHGTTNLRIVDASVFPEIPGLFIVTPIYMISEKASEVIIRDNQKS